MFTKQNSVKATLAVLVLGVISASQACPVGIEGIADPSSTVCAQSVTTGELWCTTADSQGNFYIIGTDVPPSNADQPCLPTGGQFWVYQADCYNMGMLVDRDNPSEQFGGPWLDVSCVQLAFNLEHVALGMAIINQTATGGCELSNIGSSGDDGVRVNLSDTRRYHAEWYPLDPDDTAPVGATLHTRLIG